MFNYVKLSKIPLSERAVMPQVFKNDGSGLLTCDTSAVASSTDDYSADSLVRAGVDIKNAPQFGDTSLNTLDSVDEQATKILESEKLTKSTNNENK